MSASQPPRVVSLLPAATEMACLLGASSCLVGRSHECDHPPGIHALPACTRAQLAAGRPSARIDSEVKALAAAGQPLFELDVPLLRRLAPDLILTQEQCDVCAVSPAAVEAALADWTGPRPRVVTLGAARLTEVWEDLAAVGLALGLPDAGKGVISRLKSRVVDVIQRTAALPRRPTVACLEWFDPLMAAGNWVPELVELAGGTDVFGEAGRHSPWIAWEAVVQADPEVLVLMPCGFDLPRTRAEAAVLAARPEWPGLRAVRRGQVWVTDGNAYFNRPGPRLVESLEILAEVLHPGLFSPALHRGGGWQPLA